MPQWLEFQWWRGVRGSWFRGQELAGAVCPCRTLGARCVGCLCTIDVAVGRLFACLRMVCGRTDLPGEDELVAWGDEEPVKAAPAPAPAQPASDFAKEAERLLESAAAGTLAADGADAPMADGPGGTMAWLLRQMDVSFDSLEAADLAAIEQLAKTQGPVVRACREFHSRCSSTLCLQRARQMAAESCMGSEETCEFLGSFHLVEYKTAGEFIIADGETNDTWRMVSSGCVVVTKGPKELVRLYEGHTFGENSVLSGATANASIVSGPAGDAACMCMGKSDFVAMAEKCTGFRQFIDDKINNVNKIRKKRDEKKAVPDVHFVRCALTVTVKAPLTQSALLDSSSQTLAT